MSLTSIIALIAVAFIFFYIARIITKRNWIDPKGLIAIALFILCIAIFFGTNNPHGQINQISLKKIVIIMVILISVTAGAISGNKKCRLK